MDNPYKCCNLCPRRCKVDRTTGVGFCRCGDVPLVNLYKLHYGEEPVISGTRGSGTVFFEGCGTGCVFCQNHVISAGPTGKGSPCDASRLAEIYLELQEQGAHNVNLVTPMHHAPVIAESLRLARDQGLILPVAVNSSGYDSVETLRMLAGLVDIYMPDMKFCSADLAGKFARCRDYWGVATLAIDEMVRQVGDIKLGDDGMLRSGVIVRHLMLPGCLFDSRKILEYLTSRYGNRIFISLMSQYTPMPHILDDPDADERLKRTLSPRHYELMCDLLADLGQENAFVQETGSVGDELIPEFVN